MSIAPIVQSVTVGLPVTRAFALFTGRMGRWWTPNMTIGAKPHVDIVIEPASGGRWFERDEDGAETDWGKVLAWEPPTRVLLGWQLDATFKLDPNLVTEVEVRFDAQDEHSTLVTLEHCTLDRFGPSAAKIAEAPASGWPGLMQRFADFATASDANSKETGE